MFMKKKQYLPFLLGILFILGSTLAIGIFDMNIFILPGCLFHQLTGYYCFGCGGTRAVDAFFHGHFVESFLYHPFVSYFFIMLVIFSGSAFLKTVTNGKVKGIKARPIYLYLAAVIIILQCIIKNFLHFKYGMVL